MSAASRRPFRTTMSGPSPEPGGPLPAGEAGAGSALIVGCGVIGASIGMALRHAGWQTWLADVDPDVTATAAALGSGTPVGWPPAPGARRSAPDVGAAIDGVRIAIVAVPPDAIAQVIDTVQRLTVIPTVMHVGSVQTQPLADLEATAADPTRVVGTHPMAGSERGGPGAGSPGLFRDRPWVLCVARAAAQSVARATAVIEACGARAVRMAPEEHDRAVALVSHLPQLASSAVAALLADGAPEALAIAGSGVRDVTRLADADAALWRQIVVANAPAVAPLVAALRDRLSELLRALEAADPDTVAAAVSALVDRGRAGRGRLGGKHGGAQRRWAGVRLVIPDQPGALVDVLTTCEQLQVNVEDLRVEHTAGRANGLLELLVEPGVAGDLAEALRPGWEVVAVVAPHD